MVYLNISNMAWNKEYKKKNYWQKKEKPEYKPKRGPLNPLMTEEEKSSAKVEDLAYDFACRMTRLYQWGMEGSREVFSLDLWNLGFREFWSLIK